MRRRVSTVSTKAERSARTIFRKLASGGRVRALPQRLRRAGRATIPIPGTTWVSPPALHPGRMTLRRSPVRSGSRCSHSETPLHPLPPPLRFAGRASLPATGRGEVSHGVQMRLGDDAGCLVMAFRNSEFGGRNRLAGGESPAWKTPGIPAEARTQVWAATRLSERTPAQPDTGGEAKAWVPAFAGMHGRWGAAWKPGHTPCSARNGDARALKNTVHLSGGGDARNKEGQGSLPQGERAHRRQFPGRSIGAASAGVAGVGPAASAVAWHFWPE